MSKAAELANLIGNINAGGGGVNRNVIINGAMNVAQRSTSETGVGSSGGYLVCDRWQLAVGNTDGRLTMSQDSSVPTGEGFANSLKLDCTTADTSIAAAENLVIQQKIEGQNLQSFAKGTSSAKPFAVSFYVKGNGNATYMCELRDRDNDRHNTQQFAVTSSWNRIELTFSADTTGAFDDDNASSLELRFWLHAGSTYSGGSYTANTWASTTNANRAAGISSFFDSTDRTFFITGVQLEVGQNPTEFEHEPFERTLEKCRRYYFVLADGRTDENQKIGNQYGFSSAQSEGVVRWGEMRASPSLDHPTGSNYYAISSSGDTTTFDNMLTYKFTQRSGLLYKTGLSITQGRGYRFFVNNASAYVHLDAEL